MSRKVICSNCGTVETPKMKTKGSFIFELALWCCFLVPGILYSFWRISSRCKVCRKCDSPNLVPLDSPRGRELLGELRRKQQECRGCM